MPLEPKEDPYLTSQAAVLNSKQYKMIQSATDFYQDKRHTFTRYSSSHSKSPHSRKTVRLNLNNAKPDCLIPPRN